jgi:hypothetical protein
MVGMLAATRAELLELQSVRIIPAIFFGVVGPFPTVVTRQRDQHPFGSLRHRLLYSLPEEIGGGRPDLRPDAPLDLEAL